MNTLDYIIKRFNVDINAESPIQLDFNRNDLAQLFKELGYKVGAEVGVDKGYYSETLAKANPEAKIFCIDPWKSYRKYPEHKIQHNLNVNFNITRKRLAPYNCEILRESSTGALKHFEPNSLDFVYIDGNHEYDYVMEDLIGWSKVVKKGHIISGHDYRSAKRELKGVTRAVDEYVKKHNIKFLFRFARKNDSSYAFVNI